MQYLRHRYQKSFDIPDVSKCLGVLKLEVLHEHQHPVQDTAGAEKSTDLILFRLPKL